MPVRLFLAQGDKLINRLESDINEWRRRSRPKS
jgi:hypothetical protein